MRTKIKEAAGNNIKNEEKGNAKNEGAEKD
jgi:hypothetical protein